MVDGVLLLVVVVEVVVLLVLLIVVVVLVDGGSALAADRSTLEPASSKLSSNRFKMCCFKNMHCTAFKRNANILQQHKFCLHYRALLCIKASF